ncbi:MAG: glycosyltransferase family 4 protein [Crocinitomicaceae bacterium]|nr:glycosyltransferase family 4 protein [Crocinitomicaceae bacterium]
MKIAHLTSVHAAADVRIFVKECSSLARAGNDVYYVVPNSESGVVNGVQIISFKTERRGRIKRMWKTVNEVYEKALELDADVYHLHDPELLRIGTKLKKKGKHVIYDAHEDLPRQILAKQYIPKIIRKTLSVFAEKTENRKAKKLSAIVAATPFIRERFKKVNPNTIDVNNYPILEELIQEIDYLDKTENNICYVGGITEIRGILELIESTNEAQCKLILAGIFSPKELEEKAKSTPGWKNVDFLGMVDRKEISNIYKNSKAGIVTLYPTINYLDSLPIKMFEYMVAGLPVVASNFPYWIDIVEKNEAGICVDPKNPNEIAKAVKHIFNDPYKAKVMGEKGKKLVLEKYNWKNEESKLLQLYESLK